MNTSEPRYVSRSATIGTLGHYRIVTDPIGGRLILRHASKRSSGTWGPDDYDVIDSQGRDIGRISKPRAGVPPDHPWEWAITGAVVMPHLRSHGCLFVARHPALGQVVAAGLKRLG